MMRFELLLLLLFAVFFSHWISIGCCTQQKVKRLYERPQERDEAHKSAAVKRSLPAVRPTKDAALWSCNSFSNVAANAPACDGVDDLQYDSTLASFPAVQENTSTQEAGKTQTAKKDRRGKLRNISRLPRDKFVDDELPLGPTEQEEIPTFHEWTKIMLEESEKSQSVSSVLHTASKKLQQTITNYASVECGAKILSSNPEAKSTSAVLMENMDMYMLNPCKNKIWFIIELCQPIQIKQLDIANFEIFSSNLREFLVSVSDRYPQKTWVKLGTFQARDERVVQSFMLDQHSFARYVKVELLSHFGSEHFCPLSLIRVFGTSMMEEYELSSETSDRPPLHDEQDSDPVGFPSVEDKTSDNLIGSAKDVLLTMVNNIAVNMLGGGEGNSSSGDSLSNLHTSSSVPASAMSEVTAVITPSASPASCLPEDLPTPEPIVTLLPREDEDNGSETHEELSGEKEDVTPLCLEDILLQRCPSQSFTQKTQVTQRSVSASITTSKTRHRDEYSPGARASDLSPSLSSELLLQVSHSSLTFTLSEPVELTYSSFSSVSTTPLPDPDHMIESEEPLPEIFPRIMKSSSSQTSVISSYQLVDGLVSEMVTPISDESPSTEILDVVDSSVNMELILGEMLHNSSGAPHHGSSQKESVFMRLNNRIKALEMNMSLSGRYLEQLSQRYRKQVEEMQRAFNKTILKLQDTAKTAEEQDQRQTDSILLLQVQLENVTSLLLGLSESVTQLQQEVADRKSCIFLCLLLCVILVLLICLNFHQLTETLDSEKELTNDQQVLPRNTVLCPLSQMCLQTTVENGPSEENLCLEKCKPLSLKPCADGPLILSGTCRTPPCSPSPMALDLQLCSADTDAAASDTSSDETLFCGLGSCSRLCDALPRARLWTDSSTTEHMQDQPRWPRL